ncbi:MAG: succinate--CoA ligase subunit alpha [Candidatus Dasytiphilus stammeri]
MAILINKNTKVICQGITGIQGTIHSAHSLSYGTKITAGVTPGQGGQVHLGVPIFNTVIEAIQETGSTTSVIFLPSPFCKDSILEAIEAGIMLIITISEGIPAQDMLLIKIRLDETGVCMIGPNCPGIITPGECKIGVMPTQIHHPGLVGIVSRFRTLTYEVVKQTTDLGYGQSTCVGIGGDSILGTHFPEIIKLFQEDHQTKIIILIGKIGDSSEEECSSYIKKYVTKPVVAYIAGSSGFAETRMKHAEELISDDDKNLEQKFFQLERAGVTPIRNITEIGKIVQQILTGRKFCS